MAETVSSAVGIADIKEAGARKEAEQALNELTPDEHRLLVEARTRGKLSKLKATVASLNEGKTSIANFKEELKNTTEELKKESGNNGPTDTAKNPHETAPTPAPVPAAAPTPVAPPAPVQTPASSVDSSPAQPASTPGTPSSGNETDMGPDGPLDGVLPTLIDKTPQLKDTLKKLAGIPVIGGFLLTMFFSKKALKKVQIDVTDISLEGVLKEFDKSGQSEIERNVRELLQKKFKLEKPENLLILANEDETKGPRLSVGQFMERCPEHFPEDTWKKICTDLKERGAVSSTSGSVMNFMINYLKNHNKSWEMKVSSAPASQ